jgi:hypothetical protein
MFWIGTGLVAFFFVGNFSILLSCAYWMWRPYRTKIFFSYSHKDADIAKRILAALKDLNFRVWVDFDTQISEGQIENRLGGLIKRRQIFILLGSVNSAQSQWVEFEIAEARRLGNFLLGSFRDTSVLVLDDAGIQVFDELKQFYDELTLACWIKEKDLKTEVEIAEMAEKLEETRKIGTGQPLLRRMVLPMVTMVDFRQPFDVAIKELIDYLKANSRIGRIQPEKREVMKTIAVVYMIYEAILTLFCGLLLTVLLIVRLLS